MSSDKDTLLSMGFDPSRVEWALKATQNRGLQPAMDHLIQHESDPIPDLTSVAASSSAAAPTKDPSDLNEDDEEDAEAIQAIYGARGPAANAAPVATEMEAKSIKCSQCGKIFKNTALANFHAEKSGHDQFEESTEEVKPLTEEEKKQKLAELRSKLADKRAAKAVQDAQDNKANEAIRRKAGKDMGKIKEEMKLKETVKAAEQARRDKIEDAKAKAAVKAQIEADKRARAEKAAREKALREGTTVPTPAAASPASASTANPAPSGPPKASKDYKETRLQIRLAAGGPPITTTLPSESTLQDVADYLAVQTSDINASTVILAQHFPRHQFQRTEFYKTLKELGLTPSAVLIAS